MHGICWLLLLCFIIQPHGYSSFVCILAEHPVVSGECIKLLGPSL